MAVTLLNHMDDFDFAYLYGPPPSYHIEKNLNYKKRLTST